MLNLGAEMPVKRKKKQVAIRQAPKERIVMDGPAKAGPGQTFIIEPVDERVIGGPRRHNNIDSHPLNRAKFQKKISMQQWSAGTEYRRVCELLQKSGIDSTQPRIPAGSDGTPFTQAQVDAIRWRQFVDGCLSRIDRVIIRKFCGEGYSMVDALRCAFNRDDCVGLPIRKFDERLQKSVVTRVSEALDELEDAIISLQKRQRSYPLTWGENL